MTKSRPCISVWIQLRARPSLTHAMPAALDRPSIFLVLHPSNCRYNATGTGAAHKPQVPVDRHTVAAAAAHQPGGQSRGACLGRGLPAWQQGARSDLQSARPPAHLPSLAALQLLATAAAFPLSMHRLVPIPCFCLPPLHAFHLTSSALLLAAALPCAHVLLLSRCPSACTGPARHGSGLPRR